MRRNLQNRTVFLGDNLNFLRAINDECIDLIYADPPFNKNKHFNAAQGSQAEGLGFADVFAPADIAPQWRDSIRRQHDGLHAFLSGVEAMGNAHNYCYLVYMAIRLMECRRILTGGGALYLHCDQAMAHGLRFVLDGVFGERNFINEIAWCYRTGGATRRKWASKHDVILMYAKCKSRYRHNVQKVRSYIDLPGEQIRKRYLQRALAEGVDDGVQWWEYLSGRDRMRIYRDDNDATGLYFTRVNARDWWTDIKAVGRYSKERTGYPTQKPLALLTRVIRASSNEGDWVLDPFCGCATACIAAELLNRNWVGIDSSDQSRDLIAQRLRTCTSLDSARDAMRFCTTPPRSDASNASSAANESSASTDSHEVQNDAHKDAQGTAQDDATVGNRFFV